MKKISSTILVLCLCTVRLLAQALVCTPGTCNLVINGDFNAADHCGSSYGPVNSTGVGATICNWPVWINTPDLYSPGCGVVISSTYATPVPIAAGQEATSAPVYGPGGTATSFVGLWGGWGATCSGADGWGPEALQTKLAAPMVPGATYKISFKAMVSHNPIFAYHDIIVSFYTNTAAFPYIGSLTSCYGTDVVAYEPGTALPSEWTIKPGGFTVPADTPGHWHSYTYTFIYNGPPPSSGTEPQYLGLINDSPLRDGLTAPAGGYKDYVFVDSVEIIPQLKLTSAGGAGCLGTPIILTVTGGTEPETYTWSTGAVTTTPIDSATITVVGDSIYTVTDVLGCTITDTFAYAGIAPVITVSPNDTICYGATTTLHAYGGVSYTWAPSGSLSCAGCASPVAHPLGTTTYVVTGTDSSGCTGNNYVTITVAPRTMHAASNDTICTGSSTTLSVTGGSDFIWLPASVSCDTCSTIIVSPTTTTTYSVTGINNNGCPDTSTVTVSVAYPQHITISPADTICPGASVTINASAGAGTFTWSPSAGLSSASVANPVASPLATTTYVVTVDNGCISTDSVTITIDTMHLRAWTTQGIVCYSTPATLNASGAASYLWNPVPPGTTDSTSDVITILPHASTTYTVLGIDTHGCVDSDTVTISVLPPGKIIISTHGQTAVTCDSTRITLSAEGVSNYTWYPPSSIQDSNGATIVAVPTVTTTFYVTGVDANNCKITDSVTVPVIEDGSVWLPNAWTPNDDGTNDYIYPIPRCDFVLDNFSIYNRWGQLVFQTATAYAGWNGVFNGAPQPIGTFFYYITGHIGNTGRKVFLKGDITLIR